MLLELLLCLDDLFSSIERDDRHLFIEMGAVQHFAHAPSHHETKESDHNDGEYPPPESKSKPERYAAYHLIPPASCPSIINASLKVPFTG